MIDIKFKKVPSWCPYSVKQISDLFQFDLKTTRGDVKYKCAHCKKEKSMNINSIRAQIRKDKFTSLCSKCRGEIQRKISETFRLKDVSDWAKNWLNGNNKTIKDIEYNLNNGEIIDVIHGYTITRGLKFNCIRCDKEMKTPIGRIQRAITNKKYTGFCRHCLSSVIHNVSLEEPRTSRGYVFIQKSLVPKEHLHLCKWSGPVMMHRYIMAVKLNRPLTKSEIVHHVDGDRSNNDITNLELWNDSHPCGQRVEDKIKWAKELLELYKNYNT